VNLLSGNAVGLVFRSSADGISSYDVILDAVDNAFKISKRQPYQVLASYPMTVQRNHPYEVKVVASGSTIEAYLDGVKRLTVTDSTYSSGYLGVILFIATATYDDLEAREMP
jgi:levanbiose-producing levanase